MKLRTCAVLAGVLGGCSSSIGGPGVERPQAAAPGWVLLIAPYDSEAMKAWSVIMADKKPVAPAYADTFKRAANASNAEQQFDILLGSFVLTHSPIQSWSQFQAFDSAAECEDFRRQVMPASSDRSNDPGLEEALVNYRIWHSRCLPASVWGGPPPPRIRPRAQ